MIISKTTSEGSQPGTVSKGFTHMVAGLMAVNIEDTIDLIRGTFGGG